MRPESALGARPPHPGRVKVPAWSLRVYPIAAPRPYATAQYAPSRQSSSRFDIDNLLKMKNQPKRIQRKRTAGWRMPENAVSIARPGRWGNPYTLKVYDLEPSLSRFKVYAEIRLGKEPEWLAPLRGKDLACWCAEGTKCHGDVLLELANQ